MKHILYLVAFIHISAQTYGQVNNSFKDSFIEAQSYFLFEEYEEALPILTKLSRANPYNYNLKYLIGRCLLNNPYRTDKAIEYLEEAAQHINPRYKTESYKETMAPLESLFYLAEAYQKNNMLHKAIEKYNEFLEKINEEEYDKSLVEKSIASCKYALEAMKEPVNFVPKNLGATINSDFEEFNVVVSGDGKTLAFTRKLQFYDAIMVSYKNQDGSWTAPENIIPQLGVDGNVSTSSLNYAGNTLYLYNIDGYDGNMYVSYKKNDGWGRIQKLNDNVNTRYWESNAFETPDGKTLYFASNRPGGYGNLDLYMSYKHEGSDWGPAINLGPDVNSAYNDDAPIVIRDGSVLIFSSNGHNTMGDYDYFYSYREADKTWSTPKNMGYPINTTKREIMFSALEDGSVAYLSLYNDHTLGLKDIFRVSIDIPENPLTAGLAKKPANLETAANKVGRDTFSVHLNSMIPDNKKGHDSTLVNHETTSGTRKKTGEASETQLSKSNGKANQGQLGNQWIQIQQQEYDAISGQEISIPMVIKDGQSVKVDVYKNGKWVHSEEHKLENDAFTFTYVPGEGMYKIAFLATNNKGATNSREVIVSVKTTYAPDVSEKESLGNPLADTAQVNDLIRQMMVITSNPALKGELYRGLKLPYPDLNTFIASLYAKTVKADDASKLNQGYTSEELTRTLLMAAGLEKLDINQFYGLFIQHAPQALREYITGLPINSRGYGPTSFLMDIFANEHLESYSEDDILHTIAQIMKAAKEGSNAPLDKSGRNRNLIWYILGFSGIVILTWAAVKKRSVKP
jgi:tetratricopeptide (TPR) repeat protein